MHSYCLMTLHLLKNEPEIVQSSNPISDGMWNSEIGSRNFDQIIMHFKRQYNSQNVFPGHWTDPKRVHFLPPVLWLTRQKAIVKRAKPIKSISCHLWNTLDISRMHDFLSSSPKTNCLVINCLDHLYIVFSIQVRLYKRKRKKKKCLAFIIHRLQMQDLIYNAQFKVSIIQSLNFDPQVQRVL